MKDVGFTQYLRPNGDPRDVWIERSDEIGNLAQRIVDAGYCFECEVLTTGHVSLTVSDGEEDVSIELVPNGEEVPDAVDRLVRTVAEKVLR